MQVKAKKVLPEHSNGDIPYFTEGRVYEVGDCWSVVADDGKTDYIGDVRVRPQTHGVIWEVVDAS